MTWNLLQCCTFVLFNVLRPKGQLLRHITTEGNPSGLNPNHFQWGLSTWAFRSIYIIVEVLGFGKHPTLGLLLTNAAAWQKEVEFGRILKEVTRKPNRSFRGLEVHLRKEVYIGVGLREHSKNVFSFAYSILDPFWVQKV